MSPKSSVLSTADFGDGDGFSGGELGVSCAHAVTRFLQLYSTCFFLSASPMNLGLITASFYEHGRARLVITAV